MGFDSFFLFVLLSDSLADIPEDLSMVEDLLHFLLINEMEKY
jgi:hypothetical protein